MAAISDNAPYSDIDWPLLAKSGHSLQSFAPNCLSSASANSSHDSDNIWQGARKKFQLEARGL